MYVVTFLCNFLLTVRWFDRFWIETHFVVCFFNTISQILKESVIFLNNHTLVIYNWFRLLKNINDTNFRANKRMQFQGTGIASSSGFSNTNQLDPESLKSLFSDILSLKSKMSVSRSVYFTITNSWSWTVLFQQYCFLRTCCILATMLHLCFVDVEMKRKQNCDFLFKSVLWFH